jgi:hypothetical protein
MTVDGETVLLDIFDTAENPEYAEGRERHVRPRQ